MAMSVPEEAGKAVSSVAEALKSNPSCLAAICLAGIFALLTFFALQRADQRNYDARMAILERCIPLNHGKE